MNFCTFRVCHEYTYSAVKVVTVFQTAARCHLVASPGDPRHSAAMAEDAESLKLEMLDEDSLTRQPDEVSCQ